LKTIHSLRDEFPWLPVMGWWLLATVATLCVVEPCSTGIGGDAFALIWSADEGRLYGLNASGPAPMAL